MGKAWTEEERTKVIDLYKSGLKYLQISDIVGRTFYSINKVIEVYNRDRKLENDLEAKRGSKGISKEEEKRRQWVYDLGYTDQEAADELDIPVPTYRSWRKARGLSSNYDGPSNQGGRPPQDARLEKERVVLTADDLKYYKHNDNTRPKRTGILLLVAIDNDLVDMEKPVMKRADGPRGSKLGVIIGSRWEVEKHKNITEKQHSYADSVKRMCKHG